MSVLDALLSEPTPWPDMFPPRLSPSSIALAASCPEKWRRRYLLEQKEPWGGAAIVGLAVHKAAEETYRHKLETGEGLTVAAMRELTAQSFDDKTGEAEKDGIDWKDVRPGDAKDQAVLLSTAYHPVTLTVTPVAVEEWVECTIPGAPEIVGRVDVRVAGGILDVKTTGRKMSEPRPDWRLKAMVYQRLTGQPVSWHVLTKTKVPGVYTPDSEPGLHLAVSPMLTRVTERRVLAVVEQLTSMLNRYGPDEAWPSSAPMHDWQCNFCGHRAGCAWWS